MSDLLVNVLGGVGLHLGSENLSTPSEARRIYLGGLGTADNLYDYRLLVAFARS